MNNYLSEHSYYNIDSDKLLTFLTGKICEQNTKKERGKCKMKYQKAINKRRTVVC